MAYSFPLTIPTITGVRSITLRATNVVSMSQSPFTLKQQVVSHAGQQWEAEITLPPMTRAEGEEWVSFLVKLKGMAGTFLLGDPSAATPRGSASTNAGTPLVKGSGQTGDTLTVDGCPASVTGYLKAGDYIQLGNNSSATLHKVLNNSNTNGDGETTLDIFPSIRTAPADNAAVTVTNAKGRFRLSSNQTNWSINEVTHFGISFAAVEVVT
jgi:hypothetical protein